MYVTSYVFKIEDLSPKWCHLVHVISYIFFDLIETSCHVSPNKDNLVVINVSIYFTDPDKQCGEY